MTNATSPPIKFRKLRIAWSVAVAVVCLAIIALWVRSYWIEDCVELNSYEREIHSERGELCFTTMSWSLKDLLPIKIAYSRRIDQSYAFQPTLLGFRVNLAKNSGSATGIILPHWFAAAIIAAIGAAPWLRWKFSLRTMLIAIAAIAALFGFLCLATFNG